MSITKDSVMALREKTGAGLIDCKRALADSNGDMDEAVSILRKKGVATAAKKSGRSASEGVIAQSISRDRSKGILVEVNCETDFVAKNEDFVEFSTSIASELLNDPQIDLEEKRTEQVAKIGENIQISRSETLSPTSSGLVESYVHTGAKVAVLLSIGSDSTDVSGHDRVVSMAKEAFSRHHGSKASTDDENVQVTASMLRASTGQLGRQWSHKVHASSSTTARHPTRRRASRGHTMTHAPHP